MKFIKQNINWNADPNSPIPNVKSEKVFSKITLTFYMNAFMYDDVDEVVLEYK